MDNLSSTDNNQDDINTQQEHKKSGLSKKIIIICLLITIAIIVSIIAGYAVLGNKYAKQIENALNNYMKDTYMADGNVSYKPFSCSGTRTITCKSSHIEFSDWLVKFAVKDLSFTLKPTLNTLYVSSNGNLSVNMMDFNDEVAGNMDIKFDCSDEMTLVSEKSMLTSNVFCKSSIGNIKLEQKNKMFIKDDIFAKHNSMIAFLKALSDNWDDMTSAIFDAPFVMSEIENKMESPNLFDDILDVFKGLAGMYAGDITKENVIEMYEEMKDDFLLGINSEYSDMIMSAIKAIDGVIYNGNNSLAISINLKNPSEMDELFEKDTFNILFFNPNYYDILVSSSK